MGRSSSNETIRGGNRTFIAFFHLIILLDSWFSNIAFKIATIARLRVLYRTSTLLNSAFAAITLILFLP